MEKVSIIFARHGQSYANVIEGKYDPDDPHSARLDKSVIDADITELGIEQSQMLGQNLKDVNVKIVFASPLRRAIETALKAFENHPNKPKIVCLPILRECIHSSSDIPTDILKNMKDPSFADVDFSLFDSYPDKQLYWLEDFFDPEVKAKIESEIETRGIKNDYDRIIDLTLELLEDAIRNGDPEDNRLERTMAQYERSIKLRQVLKEKVQDLKGDEKAVCVSHFLILKALTSEGVKNNKFYGHLRFKNGEHHLLDI